MMPVIEACHLAYALIETAAKEAASRSAEGGVAHSIRDQTGATVEAIARWDDEIARMATCGRCFDEGLVLVFVDGVSTRLRCACSAGNAFVDLTLPYDALFGGPEPADPAPDEPRKEAWWDREPPEIQPEYSPNTAQPAPPEDGALLPADKQALIEFADSEFTRFS